MREKKMHKTPATSSSSMLSLCPPQSPDAIGILKSASNAAISARQQRKPKAIMNCFHDRSGHKSPSVAKNSRNSFPNPLQYPRAAGTSGPPPYTTSGKPDAVAAVRELRSNPRKLALLKASSTRDLSVLLPPANVRDYSTTSSSSSSSGGSVSRYQSFCDKNNNNSDNNNVARSCCLRAVKDLEQQFRALEERLNKEQSHTKALEQQLLQLTRKVQEMQRPRPEVQQQPAQQQQQAQQPQPKIAVTLPAGAEKPKSKLAAWMNLSNWFKQRPTIETLKQKNIYNNEPCFDTELELALRDELHKCVPKIVVDCCELIEERYRKSDEPVVGIYRQCGDYNKIQTLRFQIDANRYEALRQPNVDIHTLAGVLKLFLREIKSPLISANEAKTFIGQSNQWLLMDVSQRVEILKTLIRTLPEVNRDTMKYLFAHFNRLTKVPLQQTSAESLAISLTPTIFHNVQKGTGNMQDLHVILKESEQLADCIKTMIEYHKIIFECPADRRRYCLSVGRLRKTLSQPDLLFQGIF